MQQKIFWVINHYLSLVGFSSKFIWYWTKKRETFDWWWWIVLWYGWPTERRSQSYFQPGPLSEILIIANLQHTESRVWTCAEPELRLSWMKLSRPDDHHTTARWLFFDNFLSDDLYKIIHNFLWDVTDFFLLWVFCLSECNILLSLIL